MSRSGFEPRSSFLNSVPVTQRARESVLISFQMGVSKVLKTIQETVC